MLEESKIRELFAKVGKLSKADGWSASYHEEKQAHVRFARNAPTTSGENHVPKLTITSQIGKRSGSITVNQLDEVTLKSAVMRSEGIARLAPENPEHMPPLGPQNYSSTKAFDAATEEAGQAGLVPGVAKCLENCRNEEVVGAGYTQAVAGLRALGNSAGLFAFERKTSTYLSQTARTADGQGSGGSLQNCDRQMQRHDRRARIRARGLSGDSRADVCRFYAFSAFVGNGCSASR
jgi:predicted Zn-dependent protease